MMPICISFVHFKDLSDMQLKLKLQHFFKLFFAFFPLRPKSARSRLGNNFYFINIQIRCKILRDHSDIKVRTILKIL